MDARMTKRRNFSDKFKATVALEALRGDKTVQEIAAKRQLHPTEAPVAPYGSEQVETAGN
jgi:transposase